jgi:hypothetical protein
MAREREIPPPPPRKEESRSDGAGCFIATAAYGSEFEPTVKFLRVFRDEIVLQSKFQTMFNTLLEVYYRFSPPIARKMLHDEKFKQFMKDFVVHPFVVLLKEIVVRGRLESEYW